jgi:formylglycine-generating enzyme required for sulfatase activity
MRSVLICLFFLLSLPGSAITVHAADKTFTNSIGMEFVLIPAGSFMMGADKNFEDTVDNETPRHRVSISKPFYLGKYEVTQAQWTAVMGNNPSNFKGRRSNPVEQVSWNDAQAFIKRLNQKEGHNRYRLPTEAEWEYAARAGTTGRYSFGDDAGQLGRYAWCGENYNSGSTHPVGQKKPNAWGLYDMHGNVLEWVQDRYGDYSNSSVTDPTGPSSGSDRVSRGGGWFFNPQGCRTAVRDGVPPDFRRGFPDGLYAINGFRLALSPGQ